ncbi:hypothetical protein [Rhodopila sp.]|uniref:hypothetical protein n=1 Tax=Rhodopila sp. TaxID=2480087 RepID=UPI003D0E5A51
MDDLIHTSPVARLPASTRATIPVEQSKTDEIAVLDAALPVPYLVSAAINDLPPTALAVSSPFLPRASPVPEPSSALVLAVALCGLSLLGRGVR